MAHTGASVLLLGVMAGGGRSDGPIDSESPSLCFSAGGVVASAPASFAVDAAVSASALDCATDSPAAAGLSPACSLAAPSPAVSFTGIEEEGAGCSFEVGPPSALGAESAMVAKGSGADGRRDRSQDWKR